MMLTKLIRKSFPYFVVLMTVALAVNTVFAQDEVASSAPSGLATLVLLLGLAAIFSVFFITWSQTQDDGENEDQSS